MSRTKMREFMLVVVPGSRREYVCVQHEERGDRVCYDAELRRRGYGTGWSIDAAQAAEVQMVIHVYRLIVATRSLTAHELVSLRSQPNPRSMTLTVEPWSDARGPCQGVTRLRRHGAAPRDVADVE